jgi:inosose dehydratase
MSGRIAGAPISWGVCEAPGWGVQLEPDVVLAELARAGYAATETGPDGWLPGGPDELRAALAEHGLALAGAFLPVTLTSRAAIDATLADLDRVLDRIGAFDGAVLNLAVMADGDEYDSRIELDADQWRSTLAGLDEVGTRAADRGVTCALHPHAGTAVERGDDLQRVLDGSRIALCLDTGHLLLGGVFPLDVVHAAGDRIAHVHLKDADAELAERWRAGGFASMRDAVDAGIWRALGTGDANVATCVEDLAAAGYDGWYVLERDASLDSAAAAAAAAETRIAEAVRERAWVEALVGVEATR